MPVHGRHWLVGPKFLGALLSVLVVGVSGQGWSCPVQGPRRREKAYYGRIPQALGREVTPAFAPSCCPFDYGTPCFSLLFSPASLPD